MNIEKIMRRLLLVLLLFVIKTSWADENLSLSWNTFMGSPGDESVAQSVIDKNGNIYLIGRSNVNWGTPINPHSQDGGADIVIAKLNSNGEYQWHTFFGSVGTESQAFMSVPDGYDKGLDIALDSDGNVYFTGYSETTWGNPLSGSSNSGIVLGKLSNNGAYQWHRFTHRTPQEYNISGEIYIDKYNNVLVFGESSSSWGTPLNQFNGGHDLMIAKYSSSGLYLWHTFMGGASGESVGGIATDMNGNIFVAGTSGDSWTSCGTPLNAHSNNIYDSYAGESGSNIVVSKLNQNGECQWHTFLGDPESNITIGVYGMAVDMNGNIYTTGMSFESWGNPLNAHVGYDYNTTLTKFSSSGEYQWHTFKTGKWSRQIVTDISGNIYLTDKIGMAKYNSLGELQWKNSPDEFSSIALDTSGNIILAGDSYSSWGNPLSAYNDRQDISVSHYIQPNCGMECGSLALLSAPPSDNVSTASNRAIDTVQKAYLAYYGRPGDPAGIDYWAQKLDVAGGSWTNDIISAFGSSEEFQSRFGNLSTSDLIQNIYLQLFNREPDLGGLEYFTSLMVSGQASLGEIAVIILEAAAGDDKTIINHKLITANYFTEKVSGSNSYGSIESAKSILEGITADSASVVSAIAQIDGL